jgi:hypothetical protein
MGEKRKQIFFSPLGGTHVPARYAKIALARTLSVSDEILVQSDFWLGHHREPNPNEKVT